MKPVSLYVERPSGHTGSRWLASLLSGMNMSTYFQFSGLCLEHSDVHITTEMRWSALRELYRSGCKNFKIRTRDGVNAELLCSVHSSIKCRKEKAFGICTGIKDCYEPPSCKAKKKSSPDKDLAACRGVVTIAANVPQENDVHDQLSSDITLALWERGNSVKSALSDLKSICTSASYSNFADKNYSKERKYALVKFDDPNLLLAYTKQKTKARIKSSSHNRLRLMYEKFQLNTRAELISLLQAMGLPNSESISLATNAAPATVKLTPESLSTYLLDFDHVNATFAPYPCLQQQLLSRKPTPFEPCTEYPTYPDTNISTTYYHRSHYTGTIFQCNKNNFGDDVFHHHSVCIEASQQVSTLNTSEFEVCLIERRRQNE